MRPLTLTSFLALACNGPSENAARVDPLAGIEAPDEAFESLADDAFNMRRVWRDGAVEWTDTLVDLDDPFFVAERRRACGAQHGATITTACNYRVDMVFDSTKDGSAQILYARAAPLEEAAPDCVAYAECTAQIRVGAEVRAPAMPEPWAAFVVMQGVPTTREKYPHFFDADLMDQFITGVSAASREMAKTISPEDHIAVHRVEFAKRMVAYLEEHRERLRAAQ